MTLIDTTGVKAITSARKNPENYSKANNVWINLKPSGDFVLNFKEPEPGPGSPGKERGIEVRVVIPREVVSRMVAAALAQELKPITLSQSYDAEGE